MQLSLSAYLSVMRTFARVSLVRDMTFRGNFLIQALTSLIWMGLMLYFYILVFGYTKEIGRDTGWGRDEFFVFLATTMLVNGLMQTLIMRNLEEFSELIRTGKLDFALLKPIDTQFLISFQRIEWASMSNCAFGLLLLVYSLMRLQYLPTLTQAALYVWYVLCGVAIMYGLMICLAATSVWMGRNQSLYNFWFYITTFSRYPMEIYGGSVGTPLRWVFTFLIPILLAINVPARLMAKPLAPDQWSLAVTAMAATVSSLVVSRLVFQVALRSYRSASS